MSGPGVGERGGGPWAAQLPATRIILIQKRRPFSLAPRDSLSRKSDISTPLSDQGRFQHKQREMYNQGEGVRMHTSADKKRERYTKTPCGFQPTEDGKMQLRPSVRLITSSSHQTCRW